MAEAQPRKSPILQRIQQATSHPDARSDAPLQRAFHFPGSQLREQPDDPVGLPPLRRSSIGHTRPSSTLPTPGVAGACACAVISLMAVQLAAHMPALRTAMQKKWAHVENAAAAGIAHCKSTAITGGRTARRRWPQMRRGLRRFGPAAAGLLAAALLSRVHHQQLGGTDTAIKPGQTWPGRLLEQRQHEAPGAVRRMTALMAALAACAVAQTAVQRRSTVGLPDSFSRLRRRLPRAMHTWSHRCALLSVGKFGWLFRLYKFDSQNVCQAGRERSSCEAR